MVDFFVPTMMKETAPAAAVVLLFGSSLALAGCPNATTSFTQPGYVVTELSPILVAVTCQSPEPFLTVGKTMLFDDDSFVKLSYCDGSNWDPVTNQCISGTAVECLTDPQPLENTNFGTPELLGHSVDDPLEVGKVYKCNDGYAFASGFPVRVSTCVNRGSLAEWETIFDFCEEACKLPRDCYELRDMAPGNYYIAPLGNYISPFESSIMVECREFQDGGGWTVASITSASRQIMLSSTATRDYSAGYGSAEENYFIGMDALIALTEDEDQNPRPLTMMIKVTRDGFFYKGLYTNVTFDEVTHEVNLDGVYYGFSGDCFKKEEAVYLYPPGSSTRCAVLDNPLSWGVLRDCQQIDILVRPEHWDQENVCPAFYFNPLDPNALQKVNVPINRKPGSIFKYKCRDGFVEPVNRTNEGSLHCLWDEDRGVGYWDWELTLPCQFECKDPFSLSMNETHCLHHTEEKEPFGIYSAVLRCRNLNASLVKFKHAYELLNVSDSDYYYTAHYFTNPMQAHSLNDPTGLGLPCVQNGLCSVTFGHQCLTATEGFYNMSWCHSPNKKALCTIPAVCPTNFTSYRGLCYNIVCPFFGAQKTLWDQQDACRMLKSGLAYPETMDVITFLAELASSMSTPPTSLDLGIHDVGGNWTQKGLYNPNEEVLAFMGESSPGFHWRTINIGKQLQSVKRNIDQLQGACAVCQYISPTDCLHGPPPPKENMTMLWVGRKRFKATAIYTCYPGHFADANVTLTIQTLKCAGQLGGWDAYGPLTDCIPVPVCNDSLPALPAENATVETWPNFRYLNGTTSIVCPTNWSLADGGTVQNVTCMSDMAGNFLFMPPMLLPCYAVCRDPPITINATSDFTEGVIYINGSTVTGTCNPGHNHMPYQTERMLTCIGQDLWEGLSCYQACEGDIPVPGNGMIAPPNGHNTSVGTIIHYPCDSPLMFTPANETYPVPMNETLVECTDKGIWAPKGPMECVETCIEDPPISSSPFLSSWDGFQRTLGAKVHLSCEDLHLLGDLTLLKTISCFAGEWKGLVPNVTYCVIGTLKRPVSPTPYSIGTVLEGQMEPYLEGAQLNYTCMEGKMAPMGVTYYTITFTADGWTSPDPEFICYDVSYEDPVANIPVGEPGIFSNPPKPYYVGIVANYSCPPESTTLTGETFFQITYTPEGWEELPPDFVCHNVTYVPPVLPQFALRGGSLVSADSPFHVGQQVKYACFPEYISTKVDQEGNTVTETYLTYLGEGKWSELDPEFVCVLDPNAPPPPTTTETPLEMFDKNVFDEAYEITSDNHMPSIENFMGTVNGPEYVLTDGPFGFGYAIRLNTPEQCMKRSPYATPDDCTSDPKTCTKGFTIGIWERVNISFNVFYTVHKYPEDRKRYILSTGGDEFGHPGIALYHQGLAIIGLVSTGDEYWQVDVLGNFDVNEWYHIALRFIASVGLEMFKDGKKVGHCHMSKNSAPRLALLNPSELLVGCHRDADNTNYRDYNNADFDEFATWNRRLADSELSYLRGGNEEKVENLSPEECAHMLSKTDLKDSKQADIAMNMLNAMADTIPVVEESDNTTDTVKYNGTVKPLDAAGLKLKGIADVIHEVTKPKVIRDTYTVEDLDTYFKVVETASKILDESYAEQWHAIEESGHRGARGVKEDMERYVDIIASRIPLDKKNPQPMSYIKTTDNIMVKIEKMSIKDFREIGGTYATPDYREDGMEDLYREWDLPFDKVKVPTDLFSDPRCQMHPVSIVTCFYDSYDDVQSSDVISDQITPEGGLELGSRVLRVNISIDKPLHRKGHPKYYECHFDPKKVGKARIRFNLENKLKMPQLRALSFHHNELQTPVKQRLCIWWNTAINGWDTAGCKVLDTTSLNTKCVCRHWGTVATLVEFVEEKYPPYESDTAKYVKLFLYIISDICLLIYILVVFLAGDLKDQFHISGAALSVSVIGGSTALLISDSENIQSDRHNCAAMGTVIQGFYLMSGGWVAMLGHAGFKAVSKGIITGRLKSYCLISSGIALAVVGVSYAFYIHDMGTDPRCFIAWDDNLKLILFFCPLMCFLCVGVFFACVIFFNIRHAKKLNKAIETDLSSFILGSTYVMIYYFIVWVVGILSYIHFDGEYLGCYPTFQILNSLVGVVILLSLGIHSLKFRRVLTAASKRRGEMLQKMKETANKAKPKALNKPKGNNAKAPPAKAPPPSKPSTNPPPTQPPANPPPPQAPPKPSTPAPPAKPPTPQPPADLCPPAENPSQQAADLLDL